MRRVGLLVLFFCSLAGVGHLTGLTDALTVEQLRGFMESAGALGRAGFVLAFCVGYAVTVPGMLFVAAAVAAYGPLDGGLFAYGAALLAVSGNFALGRRIGGRSLAELRWGFAQRALANLDARPVRTIAFLRLVLMLTPPFDYGLGLSNVTYGQFLLGSALGLIPPIALAAAFVDQLIAWLS